MYWTNNASKIQMQTIWFWEKVEQKQNLNSVRCLFHVFCCPLMADNKIHSKFLCSQCFRNGIGITVIDARGATIRDGKHKSFDLITPYKTFRYHHHLNYFINTLLSSLISTGNTLFHEFVSTLLKEHDILWVVGISSSWDMRCTFSVYQ